jgi:glycosyl transferase family 54 (putative N-acetylglucosaminyltransferase)
MMPGTKRLSESRLVIGIPTVRRRRDYLLETVDALITNIPRQARPRVELIVFNADVPPEKHVRVGDLANRYAALLKSGFLSILTNPHGHPELSSRPSVLAQPPADWQKQAWNAKLTLDAAYLMRHGAERGDYYLHVEDDFLAADGFYGRLVGWFDQNFAGRRDWGMLTLYAPYDFQDCQQYPLERFVTSSGILFRGCDLLALAEALRSRHQLLPVDNLIARLLSEANRPVYVCVPSLFQNMGIISTWEGKVGLSRSPTFHEPATRRVAHDLREVVDIIRYRRRATWYVLRARVRKPRWLQRLVDRLYDRVLSFRRRFSR